MTRAASPRELVARFLEASVALNPGRLADLYAPRVTIEIPFGPPLYPARVEASREELRTRFEAGAALRRYTSVEGVVVHETADPEVLVVEFSIHGETLSEPRRGFAMPLVLFLTIRDGLIVHSRDYNSPVAGALAFGTIPQLVGALEGLEMTENAPHGDRVEAARSDPDHNV